MNIALWFVQVLLALVFLAVGVMKASQPLDKLAQRIGWVKAVPAGLVRFIGVAELLGGLGLVLPGLTGVLPWLTPAAAVGLAAIMVCASAFHAWRREYQAIAVPLAFLALAAFVAYGRFVVVPA